MPKAYAITDGFTKTKTDPGGVWGQTFTRWVNGLFHSAGPQGNLRPALTTPNARIKRREDLRKIDADCTRKTKMRKAGKQK